MDSSWTALKLARALAVNARVVLVGLGSADSAIRAMSHEPSASGLAELAARTASFRDIITKDRLSSLHLISSGQLPTDRGEILAAPAGDELRRAGAQLRLRRRRSPPGRLRTGSRSHRRHCAACGLVADTLPSRGRPRRASACWLRASTRSPSLGGGRWRTMQQTTAAARVSADRVDRTRSAAAKLSKELSTRRWNSALVRQGICSVAGLKQTIIRGGLESLYFTGAHIALKPLRRRRRRHPDAASRAAAAAGPFPAQSAA